MLEKLTYAGVTWICIIENTGRQFRELKNDDFDRRDDLWECKLEESQGQAEALYRNPLSHACAALTGCNKRLGCWISTYQQRPEQKSHIVLVANSIWQSKPNEWRSMRLEFREKLEEENGAKVWYVPYILDSRRLRNERIKDSNGFGPVLRATEPGQLNSLGDGSRSHRKQIRRLLDSCSSVFEEFSTGYFTELGARRKCK